MATSEETTTRGAGDVKSSGSKDGKGGKGDTEDGKKGGKAKLGKKKLIIIAVVLLAVVGVGLKFTVLAPKTSGTAKVVKPVAGVVQPLPTELTVNLADGHFLRVAVSLQLTVAGGKEVDPSEATQVVIGEFSNRTVVELTGQKARDKAKAELLVKLEKLFPKKVMDVYYTGFVTQ